MTILDAIQANPILANVPINHIEASLISRSVDGSADYDASSLKDVELVSADLYVTMSILPEFKEGQLSLKYDAKTLKDRALSIYTKYEDPKADEIGPTPINVGISSVDA